ncbi:ABC transporter substrate-binding protein [Paenibacillus oryzae]|uniref:ABC transporter substrate-binding protein n=1 Tax=Paenibacillus oryzae TaxID=1844972 RepID=A0A1A5YMR2_9BACL|nr:ABC transporter substrate-binding protein [Paenibacillus oryzae]OBR66901.1 ABC transporter substrate-binding protein [Paenibacillus oryzae]
MKWLNRLNMKSAMAVMLVLMLALIAACGGKAEVSPSPSPSSAVEQTASAEPTATPEAPAAAQTEYPLTITDETGTELTFEKAPGAVVTLVPSETETIFAIGGGSTVVGVDQWSNYPEEANSIAKIGDMKTNIEAVAALNPELILANSSMNGDAITQLRELGYAVYATNPKTYDAVVAKVEELGKIMNLQEKAGEVAKHMTDVKQQVTDAVKGAEAKKVFLEFSPGYTVGSGEFLDELITLAGGVNIASSVAGWHEVNAEEVITQNPEIIIYPDFGEEKSSILTAIESRPGWETIDAVKNKNMHMVTNDPLVRVGPRLADGLLEVAKVIHPDLVK